jgi:hypothetical protein
LSLKQDLNDLASAMRDGLADRIKDRWVGESVFAAVGCAVSGGGVCTASAAKERLVCQHIPCLHITKTTIHRSHRLRTYRRCFPGADGVRWLVSAGHAGDEAEATALGNAMLQAGLLHHVAYEHTFKGSGDLLYKCVYRAARGRYVFWGAGESC